jgi:hypothetical protein
MRVQIYQTIAAPSRSGLRTLVSQMHYAVAIAEAKEKGQSRIAKRNSEPLA